MANTSAKSLLRANAARLKLLQQIILGTNALFAVVRGGIYYKSFTSSTGMLWALFCLLYASAYILLCFAARPTYSGGALVDGGEDISAPGLNEYAHDTIYLTALSHLGTIFSSYCVLFLTIIPIYAVYALCSSGLGVLTASDSDESALSSQAGLSRKERRQAERSRTSKQS